MLNSRQTQARSCRRPWYYPCVGIIRVLVYILPVCWYYPCVGITRVLVLPVYWYCPCVGITRVLVKPVSWYYPCVGITHIHKMIHIYLKFALEFFFNIS